MAQEAVGVVRESGVSGEIAIARSADARYVGQGYELTVPVPSGRLDAAALERIRRGFDEVYVARYGYASLAEPVEAVTWKLSAVGGALRVALAKAPAGLGGSPRKLGRKAYFPEARGYVDCPGYDQHRLAAGMSLPAPALVDGR